jgi:hypothetical protein
MKIFLTLAALGLTILGSTGCIFPMQGDKYTSIDQTTEGAARAALVGLESRGPQSQAQLPTDFSFDPKVMNLMWVPDHFDKNHTLIPAHYYFIQVLKCTFGDDWRTTQ